jgi:mRNA interferase MazF
VNTFPCVEKRPFCAQPLDVQPRLGPPKRTDPEVISDQRFPLVCIVPITGTAGEGLLYPPLAPGMSGLAKRSFALIDHLRSVDKRRVRRVFGEIAQEEMAAIDEGLAAFLGLGDP